MAEENSVRRGRVGCPICLLKELPLELLTRIFSLYLDGKSLSTLSLALLSEPAPDLPSDTNNEQGYLELIRQVIPKIGHDRLQAVCESVMNLSANEKEQAEVAFTDKSTKHCTNSPQSTIVSSWAHNFAIWLRQSFLQEEIKNRWPGCDDGQFSSSMIQRRLSHLFVASDFFGTNISFAQPWNSDDEYQELGSKVVENFRTRKTILQEWPLWRGPMHVSVWLPEDNHYFAARHRLVLQADVTVVSPLWDARAFVSWYNMARLLECSDTIKSDSMTVKDRNIVEPQSPRELRFTAEPLSHNFLPSPLTMGKIVGVLPEDRATLCRISQHLHDQNSVAIARVPPPQQYNQSVESVGQGVSSIRFVSRSQVSQRIDHYREQRQVIGTPCPWDSIRDWLSLSSSLPGPQEVEQAENTEDYLICSWDYDADAAIPTSDECVPAMIRILKTRDSFLIATMNCAGQQTKLGR